MTHDDLARMSREELIDLILAEHAQLEALRADYEALKMKLEKGKKPPTNSSNSSQPPSRDQKPNRPKDRERHRHGPPVGHVKYELKMVEQKILSQSKSLGVPFGVYPLAKRVRANSSVQGYFSSQKCYCANIDSVVKYWDEEIRDG